MQQTKHTGLQKGGQVNKNQVRQGGADDPSGWKERGHDITDGKQEIQTQT